MAFTITLPSNSSMSTFPENTLTTYTTLLPEYITLNGSYECALLEVTCPPNYYNLLAENIMIIEGRVNTAKDARQGLSMTGLKMLLNQKMARLYAEDDYNDPLLNESRLSPFHVNTANMLERGVEVMYHRTLVGTVPGTKENLYETRELAVQAAIGLPHGRLSTPELDSVKYFLHLKELDALVREHHFENGRKYRCFRLLGGNMKDNKELINYLNQYFDKTQPDIVRAVSAAFQRTTVFQYDAVTMKCVIYLPPNVMLKLPPNLAYQLGFGKRTFLAGKTQGHDVVDVNYKSHVIYVYSDVVENSAVGDRKVPLLRAITLAPRRSTTQTVSFRHLIYQPVCCSSFRQVTVYLRDSTGQPIPFERGHVTVVLSFKPKE